jgi:Acetyltransferases, including N-acetylases of ribosomal proteins
MYFGKLVRLRAFERDDLEKNHAFVNDYDTVRGMASGILFPCSYEDEQRFIDQQSGFSRGEYQFAVENNEGELVGRCGILRVDWKNALAELGIMIGMENRSRGYGTDAMQVLCRFCFEEMNLHKIKLSVLAFNEPALKCYEKCGFKREGLLKNEIFRQGKYHDVVVLGQIREP